MIGYKKFTVCMTFRNEGDEVSLTCQSIRDTAGNDVNIIVIDDASNDGRDYESELKKYDVSYYRNNTRLGSSLGKNLAVSKCETPYFIILDAHCRFYTKDWLDKAIEIIEENDNCIYCCCVQYFNNEEDHQNSKHAKAYGAFFDYNINNVISAKWNTIKLSDEPFEVPSIMGANYICSKRYWNYLGGYNGLRLYGREEEFISLKSWLSGGSVKCIPYIQTGHKGRTKESPVPYTCSVSEVWYNEMVIGYICISEYYETLLKVWERIYSRNARTFNRSKIRFNIHLDSINKAKEKFETIKKMSFAEFDKSINKTFQSKIGFDYKKVKEKIGNSYVKYKKRIP